MIYKFAPLALLALAACAPVPATQPAPDQPRDLSTCNGAQYTNLIGQDATALERVMILGQVRVIRPNTAVTMDYRIERLNFDVDASGMISDVRCG